MFHKVYSTRAVRAHTSGNIVWLARVLRVIDIMFAHYAQVQNYMRVYDVLKHTALGTRGVAATSTGIASTHYNITLHHVYE